MSTATKIKALTPTAKAFIAQAIQEIVSDPDFGLELTEKAKKRLRQAHAARGKLIPFDEIKKRYY